MANYITPQQFTTITGVTAEQCGEEGSSSSIRTEAITKAQVDTLKDLNVTSFDASETDYGSVQTAIAYLAAHKISLRNLPLVMATDTKSAFKEEYKEQIRLLKTLESNNKEPILPADGGFDVITMDDID